MDELRNQLCHTNLVRMLLRSLSHRQVPTGHRQRSHGPAPAEYPAQQRVPCPPGKPQSMSEARSNGSTLLLPLEANQPSRRPGEAPPGTTVRQLTTATPTAFTVDHLPPIIYSPRASHATTASADVSPWCWHNHHNDGPPPPAPPW